MSWIRVLLLLGLLGSLIGPAAAQRRPLNLQETQLQPGTPVERAITSGQIHNFSVTADQNSLVQISIEQQKIDVVVYVYGPNGKKVSDHDTPNGADGPENFSFVTVEKGPYRVAVTPFNGQEETTDGRYVIKIIEVRPATDEELKRSKNQEDLKARALALFADIEGLIPELRTPQTRIKIQLQAAQMLWNADEKRALKYANDAIAGLKEMYGNLNPDTKEYTSTYHAITNLRNEIIQALITQQPELALNFIRSTPAPADPYGNPMSNPAWRDTGYELQLANEIYKKDPKRTLEIARESLKTGYSPNFTSTINTLRQKNPDMAAELANDIATKLLDEKSRNNPAVASLLLGMLQTCALPKQNQSGNTNGEAPRALISQQQYRDLLQKAVTDALAFKPPSWNSYTPERDYASQLLSGLQGMGTEVDTVMNGGAAAIEKRFAELSAASNPQFVEINKYNTAINDPNVSVDQSLELLEKAPKDLQNQLYIQLASRAAVNGDVAKAKQIIKDHITNAYERHMALTNIEQQGMYRAISSGRTEEALRSVASISNPQERAYLLSQLVNQIGPGYKRSTALNLLELARSLVSPSAQAQDQAQLNALFEIAKAFSRYDSKRAFEILDPLVDQFNEMTTAARTLNGFASEFYEQEELNFNNGNAVGNAALQMTSTLGMLGVTNFERAKLTADRIRLPEVRLRAYLDLAQQALQR